MSFHMQINVKVNPTEDLERVKDSVQKLFSLLNMRIIESSENVKTLIFEADNMNSLSKFKNILKQERIRSAVRRVLNQSVKGRKINFYLNKQVASAGHVSLCELITESPLGPIEVEIETDNPYELIEWLTPTE